MGLIDSLKKLFGGEEAEQSQAPDTNVAASTEETTNEEVTATEESTESKVL